VTHPALARRRSGVLLHPTSLPGPGTQGSIGAAARRFVDQLSTAGASVWQMLPLGPTHDDRSPYQCLSAHAGSPDLVCAEDLVAEGWLATIPERRETLFEQAQTGFTAHADLATRNDYADFRATHGHWLDDYALFAALRRAHDNAPWWIWPEALRKRAPAALLQARRAEAAAIERECFTQYLFYRQWQALRHYAQQRGVLLFGDLPIFVALDSAEVWAHPEYFQLDAQGQPEAVAGVPPDYFSATGQRWGNPLYRWERMQADGFRWWRARLALELERFDLLRVDHFRGFEAYWSIPAADDTAVNGHWVNAPGADLFDALAAEFPDLPLIAEDLGVITPEVEALRLRHGLPGMKILQFAFDGGADNPYLPHQHQRASVVYTGTHDNDTTLGWFDALDAMQQQRVRDYLGTPTEAMPWPLIRTALASVARLAVIPLQDLLSLGPEARMNTPGIAQGNWRWRFDWAEWPDALSAQFREWNTRYGRC
jgi:4-alpha-glucanotransferase